MWSRHRCSGVIAGPPPRRAQLALTLCTCGLALVLPTGLGARGQAQPLSNPQALLLTEPGGWSSGSAEADWQSVIVYEGADAATHRAALIHAIELLPRRPVRVAIVDASEAKPEVQKVLRQLDAFIIEGSRVVYVIKQSALMRGAIAGSSLHRHALAAVLWHEMAHADGADEREARAREQALWTSYVRDQRVDSVAALRYLTALDRRPGDQLQAWR